MLRTFYKQSLTTLLGLGIVAGGAIAAAPDAGETIGNQAAATYESGGQSFTVQSNTVTTTVNEVYGVTLVTPETRSAAPGNFVTFAHVLTNNANTADTFTLLADNAAGDFTFDSLEIFADADFDGNPDSLTPITVTPNLASGASYGIVVRALVNSTTATSSETATFDVTATSVGDAAETETITDTVSISNAGIVEITKAQSLADDVDSDGVISEGDVVEVVINYTHTGLSSATNVLIEDVLPTLNSDGEAITLTHTNTGGFVSQWSGDPSATLDDAADGVDATAGSGATLEYDFGNTTAGAVTVLIDSVPVGNTGAVTFYYTVTTAPEGEIINIATVDSDGQVEENSNPSVYSILGSVGVVLADAAATGAGAGSDVGDDTINLTAPASSTDDGTVNDDIIQDTDDLFPGQSTAFEVVLTNISDVSETFVLNVANTPYGVGSAFPSGTTFQLVSSDGVTPIVGNSVTLTASEVRALRVIATIPTNATPVVAPAGFEATVTAVANSDPSVTNAVGLSFAGAILQSNVDLFNTADSSGAGNGNLDNGGNPFITENANPGDVVEFPLSVTIPSGEPNKSFDLTAGDAIGGTNLPAGWTVEFFDTLGNLISNTGSITGGSTFDYVARVTIPANAPATGAEEDLFFTVTSSTTGGTDSVNNAVEINEIVDISVVASTTAQVAPSGIVVIQHTITNEGNSDITAGAIAVASAAGANDDTDGLPDNPFTDNGFAVTFFRDTNGNGSLDGADTAVSNISDFGGLAAGASELVFVRVQAPAGAATGLTETGDVAVSLSLTSAISGAVTDSNGINNELTDTILVITGDLTLDKTQALDVDCNGGEPAGAYTAAAISADPGQCIAYRIVATNSGSEVATLVVINDVITSFTTYETCTANACAASATADGVGAVSVVAPADEATGTVSTDAAGFTLTPASTATLDFVVQIDN